jgi:hypothetical protein
MANKALYIDYDQSALVTKRGAREYVNPPLAYQESGVWRVTVLSKSTGTALAVNLSDASTWSAAVDDDFNSASEPMVRILNADIDSSAAASGVLDISMDANTATFLAAVGTSSSITAYFEIRGYNLSGAVVHYLQIPILAKNAIDPSGGTPPAPTGNYYTKTESDARYLQSAGANDIEITDSAKGLILEDRTTATRYRLYIDNGIFGIEEVI